jgi:hypothetical protein
MTQNTKERVYELDEIQARLRASFPIGITKTAGSDGLFALRAGKGR